MFDLFELKGQEIEILRLWGDLPAGEGGDIGGTGAQAVRENR